MKLLFCNVILFLSMFSSLCQNNVHLTNTSKLTSDNRWNLNEYVWSHTHSVSGKSDKQILDFEAIDNWTTLSLQDVAISSDGKYFVYGIQNKIKGLDTVIVQSTFDNWRIALSPDAIGGFFSADNRQYIYKNRNGIVFIKNASGESRNVKGIESYKINQEKDRLIYKQSNLDSGLVLLNLINDEEKRINGVVSYIMDRSDNWLACKLKNKNAVLRNLKTGSEVLFEDIDRYSYDLSGKWFVCQTNAKELIIYNLTDSEQFKYSGVKLYWFAGSGEALLLKADDGLKYINFSKSKQIIIGDTTEVINYVSFDKTGKQVAYVTGKDDKKVIWYWKEGMKKAEHKVNNQTLGIGNDITLQDRVDFSGTGKYLQFVVQPVNSSPVNASPDAVKLDVWGYQDKRLQTAQPYEKERMAKSVILNVETGMLLFPERQYERLGLILGDNAIIRKSGNDEFGDRFWEKGYYDDSIWVISLKTLSRHLLPVKNPNDIVWISPDSQYLLYFSAIKGCHYFRYELSSGKAINISANVPFGQLGITWPFLRTSERPSWGSGIKLWIEGEREFLVNDNYGDIWQLDPTGQKQAICMTNGYGKLHNVSFSLLNLKGDDQSFIGKDTLLLSGFNRKTKQQGFYCKEVGKKGNPEILSVNSCFIEGLRDGVNGEFPIKAKAAKVWLLNRQTDTAALNFIVTRDFKTFFPITHNEPHKRYNWLSAELHSFKQLDGTLSQGILYKPENFDSTQRYPVIISFYGNLSDQLYVYPNADYIDRPAIFDNPAWMVSHGYLVFTPDIYFIKDQWGPSTINTIEGAVRYLRKLSYVDGECIGAGGHSNSGRFGYYLLTHSKSFAAMSMGSGFTGADVLSGALSFELGKGGKSCLETAEVKAYGTGLGNIWQNKARWIEHIAPLQADKAVSPFLLFHNKKDGDDVRLAAELFLAFRRLEKKCWWLQYDNGLHIVSGNDARDWTIRYTQFFDHYLKSAPAPRWMTRGINSSLKGIETGFELEPGESCTIRGKGECKVCNKWNKLNMYPTGQVHLFKE